MAPDTFLKLGYPDVEAKEEFSGSILLATLDHHLAWLSLPPVGHSCLKSHIIFEISYCFAYHTATGGLPG